MLSKYFEFVTQTDVFKYNIDKLFNELEGKRVIIYGAGDGFIELNKEYSFREKFDVIALADKKFEIKECNIFSGYKAITPDRIPEQEYDYILVTNETNDKIISYLKNTLNVNEENIRVLFKTDIPDEAENISYIESFNFSKTLEKLKKKIKNKTVVIYGCGAFFQVIKKYYNISGLNILGVTDKKFVNPSENEKFLGYKVYSLNDTKELNPDYILVATKKYIEIIENLYYETFAKTKIKIKPLVKKNLKTLIQELWS